jgi:hypothetical protein
MLPIVVSGASAECAEQVLLGKGTYFAFASASPFAAVAEAFSLAAAPWHAGRLVGLSMIPYVLLPAAALAALVAAAVRVRGDGRARTLVVGAFVAAGTAFLFPRADLVHMRHTSVVSAAGLAAAAGALGFARHAWLRRTAAAVAAVWLAATLHRAVYVPLCDLRSGTTSASELPHFRGLPIASDLADSIDATRRGLRGVAADGPTLVVCPRSAFWYLVSDTRNPTRYDYAYVTTFGRRGEDATIDALRDGRIRAVFVQRESDPVFTPARLVGAVRATFRPAAPVGEFDVYRAP